MKLIVALTAAALLAAPAISASCRDPKTGRAAKCDKGAVAFSAASVTKDKNGRCHQASGKHKGQLVKCP